MRLNTAYTNESAQSSISSPTPHKPPLLEMRNIVKSFPGILALAIVKFDLPCVELQRGAGRTLEIGACDYKATVLQARHGLQTRHGMIISVRHV